MALGPRSDIELRELRRSQSHAVWYGWQTLAVDGAATAVLLLGAAVVTSKPPTLPPEGTIRPTAFEATALGVYALTPSAVHFARGNPWSGISSVGLRIASPVLGFLVGSVLGSLMHVGGSQSNEFAAAGAVVGVAGAAVTDAAVLGWERWTAPMPMAVVRRDF